MDENFLNVLYIEHTGKIGVLKDDKDERVSIILGTDKTLVERKREGKTYLLVPLTKSHTFVCKGNSIDVDGEHIKSESSSVRMVLSGLRLTKKRYLRQRKE